MSDTSQTDSQAIQAIGLLSTLAPDVQLNPDDLIGTAKAIVAHVKAQGLPVEPRLKPLADNAELLDRLRERTESHLAASARDVATIQRQAVELDTKTAENEAMRTAIKEAHTELSEFNDIINNSHGVAGWHLNGNIATWDEFEINPDAALAKLQPFIKP